MTSLLLVAGLIAGAEGIAIKRWLWTWGRLVPQHWK